MFCSQCGKKISDNEKMCRKCRAKMLNQHEEEVRRDETATEEKVEKPKKKGMWLLWCVLAVIALVIAYFALNICISHEWQDATCVAPRTCIKCERTEGEALGHKWQDANCVDAKKCSVCGETEGEALGHKWKEATCTEAKRCIICNYHEGEPSEHDWKDATCTKPKTCKVCGKTSGKATNHNVNSNGVCTVCGESIGIEITQDNFADFFDFQYEWEQMDVVGGPILYSTTGYYVTGCKVTITSKKTGTYENVEFSFKLHLEDRYGDTRSCFDDGDTYETIEVNEYGNGYGEIEVYATRLDPQENLAYLAPDMKLTLVGIEGVYKQ